MNIAVIIRQREQKISPGKALLSSFSSVSDAS
jgi:hypothetical protein